jgi:hypothetical protein
MAHLTREEVLRSGEIAPEYKKVSHESRCKMHLPTRDYISDLPIRFTGF